MPTVDREKKIMLTAEQLYELYLNMGSEEPGTDRKPRNRGFAALKHYAEASHEIAEEIIAAGALKGLLTQMERVKDRNMDRAAFGLAVDAYLKKFNNRLNEITKKDSGIDAPDLKKAVEEVRSSVLERVSAYKEEMDAMRSNFMRLAGTVHRFVYNDKLGHKDISKEDLQAIAENNFESMKQQLALMIAMDEICRKDGPSAALDPEKADELANSLMESDEIDSICRRLTESDMSADAVSTALLGAGHDGLSRFFKTPEKPAPAPKYDEDSAIGLFISGLENLKKDAEMANASPLYEQSDAEQAKMIADGLLELFAIKDLGHKDPYKWLSRAEIEKKKSDILDPEVKDKGNSLYRAVYTKASKDPETAKNVLNGIKVGDTLGQMQNGIKKDAKLQKRASEKKEDGPQIGK